MISGKLPNNTIWWLSTNGQKIWIESKDLEQAKFEEKGYYRSNDRIFHSQKEMGELTTSRLESRKRKDAWIIKLEAMLDVYPELLEEIKIKEIEEKKKKKTNRPSRNKREVRKEFQEVKKEFKADSVVEGNKNELKEASSAEHIKNPGIECVKVHFDADSPYVAWIKDEIDKSEKGEITIPYKELKSRMGEEFEKIDDFRIYFGLNKILSNSGIIVESQSSQRGNIAIIRKIAPVA